MKSGSLLFERIDTSDRTRRDMGDLAELMASISERGLIHPPTVRQLPNGRYVLVAGARRVAACKKLGWKAIDVTITESLADELDALYAEGEENSCRKKFTPSEAVAHAEKIAGVLAERAKNRQREGGRKGGAGPVDVTDAPEAPAKLAEPSGETREQVAAAVGMGRTSLAKAQDLVNTANDPSAPEPVRQAAQQGAEEMDRTGKVDGAHKKLERARRKHEQAQQPAAPLNAVGLFPVLYVDPPWRYDDATDDRNVENHYDTMSLDDIKAMHLPAERDAVLFCWTTSPKLHEAMQVLDAWGFEFVTAAVWVKDRIGMGYYFRQRHEHLLVAKRGTLPTPHPLDRHDSVIEAKRGEHSAKPEIFYELIEAMYPGLRKVELFARRSRDGWAAWGNQAPASDGEAVA